MSQENVESARRGFEAFARGGPEAVVDFWDPEIELWLPSGMIQAGGTYRGREAVLGWMKEWAEAWEEIEYTPEEFTETGDAVVVRVLYEGRGKGSGARTEGRFWSLVPGTWCHPVARIAVAEQTTAHGPGRPGTADDAG